MASSSAKMTLTEMIEEITSHCTKIEQWRVIDEVMACLKKETLPKKRSTKAKKDAESDEKSSASKAPSSEKQNQWRSLLARVREVLTAAHGTVNKDGKKTMKSQKLVFKVASHLKAKDDFDPASTDILDIYDTMVSEPIAKHEIYESEDEEDNTLDDLHDSIETRDKEIYTYLFRLQKEGTVNMMGCGRYLMERFSLTRQDAEMFANNYRTRYSELKAKYDA